MKLKILAVIPARGGSKGLPQKNIRPLAGKPLIAYSIEAALKSKYVDKTVVSTEDEEIAKIAKKYRAEIIKRPEELARDDSPTVEVVLHAINWLEEAGEHYNIIVLLEPTSPLREVEDIDKSIEILLNNKKARAIVGIAKLEAMHPEFNVVLNKEGFIRKWTDGSANFRVLRRQELDDVYFFEGSVYVSYVDTLKQKRTFYHELTLGYVVPRSKSLEVDEIYDLIAAEAIIKKREKLAEQNFHIKRYNKTCRKRAKTRGNK